MGLQLVGQGGVAFDLAESGPGVVFGGVPCGKVDELWTVCGRVRQEIKSLIWKFYTTRGSFEVRGMLSLDPP